MNAAVVTLRLVSSNRFAVRYRPFPGAPITTDEYDVDLGTLWQNLWLVGGLTIAGGLGNHGDWHPTAREKFKIGDNVKMSAKGLARKAGLRRFDRPTTGRVVWFPRTGADWSVMILRDGRLSRTAEHMDWWDVVPWEPVESSPPESAPPDPATVGMLLVMQ